MTQHWKEILPIDRYIVCSNGMLYEYDRKVITLLYQPLIGPYSFSLYMSLWAQVEENRLSSSSNSHHSLMSFMGLNLREIYEARQKLEGIGLLKTYVRSEEGSRSFLYELQPPLMPEQFFLDGMLNIYLYRKIGRSQFTYLKQFFSDKVIKAGEGYAEVTKAFQDVYESAAPPSLQLTEEQLNDLGAVDGQVYMSRQLSEGIQVSAEGFDFDLLLAGLSEALVPKKALNKKVREAISNLSYLYGIDAIQMKNIVMGAFNDLDDEIHIEDLRKAARDWYQFEHQEQLPLLIDKIQPPLQHSVISAPNTQEERLILYLDTTSPRQLLKDISGGAEPSKGDLQIVEDVMFKQKLLPGVANVLIQYVMLRTDMKLTKSYVDKIASHWARKKIATVKEAMELAKNEHRQYMEWAENKKAPKASAGRKAIRTEALPEWFNNETSKPEQTHSIEQDARLEKEKREIEEMLKEFKK